MHIITRAALKSFSEKHPDAAGPLDRWYRLAKKATWASFVDVRLEFGKRVDQHGHFLIFDIGGNKYRLIVRIKHRTSKLYIRHVMTHAEYSLGKWKTT